MVRFPYMRMAIGLTVFAVIFIGGMMLLIKTGDF
jgi:hypothetical protein